MHLNGRRKSYPLITNPGPCTPVQNHLVTHLLHHTAKKAPWQRAETKTHTVRTSMATGTSSEFITEVDRDLFLHSTAPDLPSLPVLPKADSWMNFHCHPLILLPEVCSNPGTKLLAWNFCFWNHSAFIKRQRHDRLVPWTIPAVANEEVPGPSEGWRETHSGYSLLIWKFMALQSLWGFAYFLLMQWQQARDQWNTII